MEDDLIKLIYSNETTEEKDIYEYTIYPPECTNISVTINFLQTEKVDLNELFERKMKTKYYITLKGSPSYMITTKINDVQISDGDPVVLSDEENYIYFISNGLSIFAKLILSKVKPKTPLMKMINLNYLILNL